MTEPWDHFPVLPYVTYLRVYEPLAAFSEPTQRTWGSYAEGRRGRQVSLDVEHEQALRHVIAIPPIIVPERESDDAYFRRVDGVLYICPWQTRLRSWLAVIDFRGSLSRKVADAFVPSHVVQQTLADFEQFRTQNGSTRPHILSSNWHIPLEWFVAFDPAERWLVLGDRGKHSPGAGEASVAGARRTATPTRALCYVTRMVDARRRVARAVTAIRRALGDDVVLAGIEELGRHLEEFHPHALVELDYGGLVFLLDDDQLRGDQSVAEVASGLAALEVGKTSLAQEMYDRLYSRWRAVQSLESAN